MVAALDQQRTVPAGSRVEILLEREEPARPTAPPPGTFHGVQTRIGAATRPAVEYRILHTQTGERPGGGIGFDQMLLESSIAQTVHDRAQQRATMLGALRRVEVPNSGREIWSAAPVPAGTVEADGMIAASLWHDRGVTHRHDLLGSSVEWGPRVPAALRVADLDALLASSPQSSPDRQELIEARVRLDREKLENWDFPSTRYHIGYEGTDSPALPFGQYDLGYESLRAFQTWKSWDRTNFKVTSDPFYERAEGYIPRASVALGDASAYEVFKAPRLWEYLLEWDAVYVIGTVWFYSIVAIPQTGVFVDALPVLPVPYRLAGSAQSSSNSEAVSRHVIRTQTYARMLMQDAAYQVWSPYFFILLITRIGGRVSLIDIDQPEGRLCAVVDARPGNGPALRRYVWGRTTVAGSNEVVDAVALSTPDVRPFTELYVD